MSDQENGQSSEASDFLAQKTEEHEIQCGNVGKVKVYVQGARSFNEVVILTVHDLGCDHTMYDEFISNDRMNQIRERTVWLQVEVPGQGQDASDLSCDYSFPTMQQLGESLVHVLDHLRIKEVVCFGEGAGANILARFALTHQERVLGVCLIHCTGTTAGFMESVKDKVMNWKLDHIGMNPTAEAYLVIHRFGSSSKSEFNRAENQDQLKAAVENYQTMLRSKTNPRNLKKFVETFLKRTSISDKIHRLKCHVLFVTGQRSLFNRTTRDLHQKLVKQCKDKGKVEFIEIQDCANPLEQEPEKLVESFQYFLQGLGLVSSVPMRNVMRGAPRLRSMSMEEYDQPKLRSRSMSGGGSGTQSPMGVSPPKSDAVVPPPPETVAN